MNIRNLKSTPKFQTSIIDNNIELIIDTAPKYVFQISLKKP